MRFFSFLSPAKHAAPVFPPLCFHNTLTNDLEEFEPLSKNKVTMYNCGPTVYDEQHIGNLFAAVFSNTLRRTLDHWGYQVAQVTNITDVGHLVSDADEGEDKMEASARKKGQSAQDIAKEITQLYFDDLDRLGVDRTRVQYPRATEYIGEQIALVQALEEKGYAYRTKDGVYFDTSRFSGYGKLGQIDLAGLKEGARIGEHDEKRTPYDFALWKLSPKTRKKSEKRQQEWDSPWGVGFPGWHIECTAMIFKLLGRQIDIHTGGIEHIPVHHNNEIAQAESITGKQYVRYWMHHAHITIEGRKISKSLGNTVYLRQIIDRGYSPRSFRYWVLTGHYRTPMNFTWEAIGAAHTALHKLKRIFWELDLVDDTAPDRAFMDACRMALANDLDTPSVIALMWDLVKNESVPSAVKRASLVAVDQILGLGLTEEADRKNITVDAGGVSITLATGGTSIDAEIQALVEDRQQARTAGDYARADELRATLLEKGYILEDTQKGPVVRRAE